MNKIDCCHLKSFNIEKEHKYEKGKVVIIEHTDKTREITWLTLEDIKNKTDKNDKIISNLSTISKELNKLSEKDKDNEIFNKNIHWINKKIRKHNRNLKKNPISTFFKNLFKKQAVDIIKANSLSSTEINRFEENYQFGTTSFFNDNLKKRELTSDDCRELNWLFENHEFYGNATIESLEKDEKTRHWFLQHLGNHPEIIENYPQISEFSKILIKYGNDKFTNERLLKVLLTIERTNNFENFNEFSTNKYVNKTNIPYKKIVPGRKPDENDTKIYYNPIDRKISHFTKMIYNNGLKKIKLSIGAGKKWVILRQKANIEDEIASSIVENEVEMIKECKGMKYVASHMVTSYTKKKDGNQYKIYVVTMPFFNQGDLLKYAFDGNGNLKNLKKEEKLHLLLEAAKGIQELHQKGIIHRDIKLENIFVNKNGGEVHANVGDLGSATRHHTPSLDQCGTQGYRPPEVIVTHEVISDFSQDSWSFGILLAKFFGLDTPSNYFPKDLERSLSNEEELDCINKYLENQVMPADQKSIEFLVWSLTQRDPKKRMPMSQAVKFLEKLFRK